MAEPRQPTERPSPPVRPAPVNRARLMADLAGPEFFTALVRTVAEGLGVRYALVTQVVTGKPGFLRSLAFWADGALADNIDYSSAGTPCKRVIEEGSFSCSERVLERFPQDAFLLEVGAEAFSGIALHNPSGEAIGHLCVVHDRPLPDAGLAEATLRLYASRGAAELERIQIHQELSQVSRRLQTMTDHLPGLVYSVLARRDGTKEVLFQSRECSELLGGRSLGEILREPDAFRSLVHSDDHRFLQGGLVFDPLRCQAVDREFRVRFGEGSYRWIRSIGQPVPDGDGNVCWHGLMLDVHDRRSALAELEDSRTRLGTLIASMPDPVFFKDAAGRWQETNTAAQELFGLQDLSWRGLTDRELGQLQPVFAPYFENCAQSDEQTWRNGARSVFRESIPGGDGGLLTFEVTKVPLFEADGSRQGLVVVARDLTRQIADEEERRRMERQLHLSRKMESLGQLAGGIAHDFDNLLTVILGYSELAKPRLEALAGDRSFLGESLDQINRAALQAAGLTRKLLAFGRRDTTRPEPRNPAAVIEDVRGLLDCLIGEHIEVVYELGEDLPWLEAGEGQIEQILVNLAVNGRDAMPGGGRLKIAATCQELESAPEDVHPTLAPGRYLVLEVEDQGHGIAPEHWEKVFEPFFTTKNPGQGTGLGLATVYGIVTVLGGGLSLVSEPGKGSTFRAWLPASSPAARETGAAGPSEAPPPEIRRSGTVLLCEDEEAVRLLGCRILEAAGYTVLAAGSGQDALELAEGREGPIDLLLTDVLMPGLNGPELARTLRASRPDLAVLYISGYSADVLAAQELRAEEVDLLEKPFRPVELLERVSLAIAAGPAGAVLRP